MKITPEHIEINGIKFIWGMTSNEVLDTFPYVDISRGYSPWKDLEFKCDRIAGFDSLTCTLRGPGSNKPVIQSSFELVPLKSSFFQSIHTPYVQRLTDLFGTPHDVSESPLSDGLNYNDEHAEGHVIYNCKWWLGKVLITLSVFGGIRSREEGEYAAGLYFDWLDEETAAKPFLEDFIYTENKLIESISRIEKTDLDYDQKPYSRGHYELKNPH